MSQSFDSLAALNNQIKALENVRYETDKIEFLDEIEYITEKLIEIRTNVNAVRNPAFLPSEYIAAQKRKLAEETANEDETDIIRTEIELQQKAYDPANPTFGNVGYGKY